MTEWWTSLDLFMKILWGIAIATSLIFILETVLTFIGIDHDGSFDMDTSADGSFESEPSMNLYTFRPRDKAENIIPEDRIATTG